MVQMKIISRKLMAEKKYDCEIERKSGHVKGSHDNL